MNIYNKPRVESEYQFPRLILTQLSLYLIYFH